MPCRNPFRGTIFKLTCFETNMLNKKEGVKNVLWMRTSKNQMNNYKYIYTYKLFYWFLIIWEQQKCSEKTKGGPLVL